jgi:hypothetical protein
MNEKLLADDTFAVVEVMGHNTFAGKVSEHVIGGSAFIRVDVPEIPEHRWKEKRRVWNQANDHYEVKEIEECTPAMPAFTKLIGASSIYAITPCSEEVARRVAEQKRVVPVNVLDMPNGSSPRLIAAVRHDDDDLDDEDDEDEDDEAEDDDEEVSKEARRA